MAAGAGFEVDADHFRSGRLERTGSRREPRRPQPDPFEKPDPYWGAKNNIIQRDGESMKPRQENVQEMPDELRSLLAEEKGETARRG